MTALHVAGPREPVHELLEVEVLLEAAPVRNGGPGAVEVYEAGLVAEDADGVCECAMLEPEDVGHVPGEPVEGSSTPLVPIEEAFFARVEIEWTLAG